MTTLRRLAYYLASPLEEKRDPGAPDGVRRLSMLRCAIAAFTVTMCVRLLSSSVPPMTWPEYAALVTILFAIPLAKWLDGRGLEELAGVLSRLAGRGHDA